jgi:hypothetical protein
VTYKIDDDVPLPASKFGAATYTGVFRQMSPGQSVFFPNCVQNSQLRKNDEPIIDPRYARRTMPGTEWATRTVTENGVRGVRVWRTA